MLNVYQILNKHNGLAKRRVQLLIIEHAD